MYSFHHAFIFTSCFIMISGKSGECTPGNYSRFPEYETGCVGDVQPNVLPHDKKVKSLLGPGKQVLQTDISLDILLIRSWSLVWPSGQQVPAE